ncbi:Putative undecaprenyl-phosphate N-acetylgalactosaminyl 1-phosphate transferase [bacterium HR37]|nr:Putative undecaprenyl-phosphate N-acetylgalactosaminyl 1-phosphate transferase [bacterium HR37]
MFLKLVKNKGKNNKLIKEKDLPILAKHTEQDRYIVKGLDFTVKEYAFKRIFDFSLALIGLIFSIPIWILVAIAIWLEDGRPILYKQRRLGKHERPFWLFKFRSMVKNAEDSTGPVWAMENDPRVTKVGRFIRATAIDELPQLINILKGDISFVGPRAERPELAAKFKRNIPAFALRTIVKPGLTGIAQVYGRYDTPPQHKLRYDLIYIKNQSFILDLKLILLSFWITFTGKWQSREDKLGVLVRKKTAKTMQPSISLVKPLGQLLIEANVITQEQLKEALAYQRGLGIKIGEALVKKGFLSNQVLNQFLQLQLIMREQEYRTGA